MTTNLETARQKQYCLACGAHYLSEHTERCPIRLRIVQVSRDGVQVVVGQETRVIPPPGRLIIKCLCGKFWQHDKSCDQGPRCPYCGAYKNITIVANGVLPGNCVVCDINPARYPKKGGPDFCGIDCNGLPTCAHVMALGVTTNFASVDDEGKVSPVEKNHE
jgi:hypothetical protein